MYTLPSTKTFVELNLDQKSECLAHLFEPCQTLANLLIHNVFNRNYQSYNDFIESCRVFLLLFLEKEQSKREVLPDIAQIISAHPRLGPSKDKLSSHSSSEQKSLAGSQEESQKLASLNALYEETFPGLRYVVFVNGRSRETIMENMRSRIEKGDIELERKEAFNAMCDIAIDRAQKLESKL